MKDSKVKRVRRSAAVLRRQFLQANTGLFDRMLGEQEMATGETKVSGTVD